MATKCMSCGGSMKKMKAGGIKKKYQGGGDTYTGPSLEDMEKKNRRNILGGLSAKLGIGTAGAGIASIVGKKISDVIKKKKEGNKEVKGMVKDIVKKAKSTKVMQKGGSTKMQMGGYAKPQMGGDNTKNGIYGIPNAGRTDPLGFKKGGTTTSRAVKPGCRGGMVKDASGKCVMERKMQKGGFPDLNKDGKVTRADILKGRGVIKKIGGSIKKK